MIAPLRWPLACYPCSIEIYEDSSICWFLPAIADIAAKIRLSIAVAVSCTSSLFSVVTRVVGCVLGHSARSVSLCQQKTDFLGWHRCITPSSETRAISSLG